MLHNIIISIFILYNQEYTSLMQLNNSELGYTLVEKIGNKTIYKFSIHFVK